MADAYLKALRKVMQNDCPAAPTTRTRAEIESDIAEISAQLRGHLPSSERLCLIEARVELRKQLEKAST